MVFLKDLGIADSRSGKIFISISYGPVIGLTYFFLQRFGQGRPDGLLAAASSVAALLFFLWCPSDAIRALTSVRVLLRSACFAIAQLLLTKSLAGSAVSASLTAALAGTVLAFGIHRALDRSRQVSVPGVVLTLIGLSALVASVHLSLLAVVAGLFQGLSFFLLKGISNSSLRPSAAHFQVFLITGILGISLRGTAAFQGLEPLPVLVAAALVSGAQVYAYTLNRLFRGTWATVIAGTRIPCSLILDVMGGGAIFPASFIVGIACVLTGFGIEAKQSQTERAHAKAA